MNLSFAGCGFMGIYHVGVAACFMKHAPHLYLNRVSGASAGAMAAACLLCDSPLGEITAKVLEVAALARGRMLGPFSPSLNITALLKDCLDKVLPDDAHLRVNGKVHISVTRVYDGENVILSHFRTKEELIQAILCSSFIPFFSGVLPPKFRGVRYMDGGFSDNLIVLDENTVTVTPFCGDSDICPRDGDTAKLIHVVLANTSIELSRKNLYRMAHIMFPPKAETLSKICQQGFDDARRFLQANNLVGCIRCVSSRDLRKMRSYSRHLHRAMTAPVMTKSTCAECESQRELVTLDRLPETVSVTLQHAIESGNRGLINWVFRHKSVRLLSILSLPYVFPVDFVYATVLKFMENAPTVSSSLKVVAEATTNYLCTALLQSNKKNEQFNAKVSCQVAITELTKGSSNKLHSTPDVKSTMNIGFSFDLEQRTVEHSHNKTWGGKAVDDEYISSDDTLDEILAMTARHEALMAYYFLDNKNDTNIQQILDGYGKPNPSHADHHIAIKNQGTAWDEIPDDAPITFVCNTSSCRSGS